MTRIAVIYYSSTGNTHQVAEAVAEGARKAGAEVRLRRVRELAPAAAVAAKPRWKAHLEAAAEIPEASLDDLEWADGYVFGSPTRFGGIASQLKQFIDTTGGLWMKGALADKPAAAFTGAGNPHGGQESTLLSLANTFYHWGAVLVPPGYTEPLLYAAGGNPYGVSFTDKLDGSPVPEEVLAAARYLGGRVARFAAALAGERERLKAAA